MVENMCRVNPSVFSYIVLPWSEHFYSLGTLIMDTDSIAILFGVYLFTVRVHTKESGYVDLILKKLLIKDILQLC